MAYPVHQEPLWRIVLECAVLSCLSSSQGGAYARGTALRGGTDVEIVIFLNCFRSFEDQKTCHTETLSAMRTLLQSWGGHPGPGLTFEFSEPKASGILQFRLTSADQENWMDVSLLPAFDVLGERSLAWSRVGGIIIRGKTGHYLLTFYPLAV